MNDREVWYRYEDIQYAAPLNEFDESIGKGRLVVRLLEYPIMRHTPKGVRLSCGRFVLNESIKMFACPTKEMAERSFKTRKTRQIRILRARIDAAERALAAFDKNRWDAAELVDVR